MSIFLFLIIWILLGALAFFIYLLTKKLFTTKSYHDKKEEKEENNTVFKILIAVGPMGFTSSLILFIMFAASSFYSYIKKEKK